jgi:hypothetical protein
MTFPGRIAAGGRAEAVGTAHDSETVDGASMNAENTQATEEDVGRLIKEHPGLLAELETIRLMREELAQNLQASSDRVGVLEIVQDRLRVPLRRLEGRKRGGEGDGPIWSGIHAQIDLLIDPTALTAREVDRQEKALAARAKALRDVIFQRFDRQTQAERAVVRQVLSRRPLRERIRFMLVRVERLYNTQMELDRLVFRARLNDSR